jgi:hypothetical protein
MKPDLYQKDLVGHSKTQILFLVKPVPEAKLIMEVLRRLRVEKNKAWSRLMHEDRQGADLL